MTYLEECTDKELLKMIEKIDIQLRQNKQDVTNQPKEKQADYINNIVKPLENRLKELLQEKGKRNI